MESPPIQNKSVVKSIKTFKHIEELFKVNIFVHL